MHFPRAARKVLYTHLNFSFMWCAMKSLIHKLARLFKAMNLVEDCRFERGLQIRYRQENSRASHPLAI